MKGGRVRDKTGHRLIPEDVGSSRRRRHRGLFAEDIDSHVAGNPALPWTGHRSRRSEVADFFRTMWSHFEAGKSTSTLDSIVIVGDEAVIFASFAHTASSTGRAFRTPVAMHVKAGDGKIVTMRLYEDTWAVSNTFFGQVSG